MSYNGRTYDENITQWKKDYPPPKRKFSIKDVTIMRRCSACDKTSGRIDRHHIEQGYFFACMRPDRYARTYMRFRKIDCDFLCRWCHDDVHAYRPYQKIVQAMNLIAVKRRLVGKRLRLTLKQCEDAKRRLRKVYKKWITRRRKRNGLI